MSKLAIIPARGGSKRIVRKNIRNFLGDPIISYSIKAAIESNLFDEVMVSTDDNDIALISKKFGAKVPFLRSINNSDDFSTTFDVIEEVLDIYAKLERHFETVCCIYPCAPFIKSEKLFEAYNLLINYKYETVFPIVSYSNPIQRALRIDNGKVKLFNPKFLLTRSQDLEPSYYDAGQFYWADTATLLKSKKLFSNNSGYVIIDELNAHDIDNEIDWKIAEMKYSLLN